MLKLSHFFLNNQVNYSRIALFKIVKNPDIKKNNVNTFLNRFLYFKITR